VKNAFVDRLHNEAMSLLIASRDRALRVASSLSATGRPTEGFHTMEASLRLTSLVSDAVAWTLTQRAVAADELSKEVAAEFWTPAQVPSLSAPTSSLPADLAGLLERAEILHRRVTFLHRQSGNQIRP
jgi:hypothetical protein